MAGQTINREIIDFSEERRRHGVLLGREALLTELDVRTAQAFATGGWVLVQGGPGLGKSALLSRWLGSLGEAPRWPHHFIRRGVEDWDQPGRIAASLAAQVEARFADQAEPDADLASRLPALLRRVSRDVLVPGGQTLALVVDGLDEAAGDGEHNPLPRFLPALLPPRVVVLCASRADYPRLEWLREQRLLVVVDLDGRSQQNEQACLAFWEHHGPHLVPPLPTGFAAAAAQRAEGSLLHAALLMEQLLANPEQERQVASIPRGLRAFWENAWARIQALPAQQRESVYHGLGLLCVAREALPLEVLEQVAGWTDPQPREDLLRATRPYLVEQPVHWEGRAAYRLCHESLRELLTEKLRSRLGAHRKALAATLARWPLPVAVDAFARRYVALHGVAQQIDAEDRGAAEAIVRDLAYWRLRLEVAGVSGLEADLEQVLGPGEVLSAVQAESHWLRREVGVEQTVLFNRLRTRGWSPWHIAKELRFGVALHGLLEHPLQHHDGACVRTLSGHEEEVNACAMTPDGQRVVSASVDRTLKVWDLRSGQELATLSGHRGGVTACTVTPDGQSVVSASVDRTLKVWDLGSGLELATLTGHQNLVMACAVTPDGQRVISASFDNTLKVWDLRSGQELITLSGHQSVVMGCTVTPDGQRVISASADGTLKVWDLRSGQALVTLSGHQSGVEACAVTTDGQRVVSASADGTLKLWDLHSGQVLATLFGHQGSVKGCAVTPDGQRVISASADNTLKVWDLRSGQELITLSGHQYWVMACAVTPDGQSVVSASHDDTLKVWDLRCDWEWGTVSGHQAWVRACAVTPDGQRVVSASVDGTLKVWDVRSGQELATFSGHQDRVNACAVTPDGQRVVSASSDNILKVWDLRCGQELVTLSGHQDRVNACAVTPDGQRVVSASVDRTLKVWDLRSGQELATLSGHQDGVMACAVTPDGQCVVSASADNTLKVWDLRSGKELATLSGHQDWVRACAVTPDGQCVVSASADGTLKVWNLCSGRELVILSGHQSGVCVCAVTSDGQSVLSASVDNTLKVWDLRTGTCLLTVPGCAAFWALATTNDRIIAGDGLGNLWFLRLVLGLQEMPLRAHVFLCHATADDELARQLERQCAPLVDAQVIELWSERHCPPGADLATQRDHHLERADIMLVLVSADLLADSERMALVHRALAGSARVLPALLRPCHWQATALAPLHALPHGGAAVTSWPERDAAWLAVVQGLQEALGISSPARLDSPPLTSEQGPAAVLPPRPPVHTEPRVLFSWIHLSDLHFGLPSAAQGWDQRLVLRVLKDDIAAQRARGHLPTTDAVLVTGDIAFAGAAAHYAEAAVFLRSLGVPDRQIFLVPGNHDVVRSSGFARNVGSFLRELRRGDLNLDDVMAQEQDRNLLRSRFAAYLEFAAAFGPADADPLGWSARLSGREDLALRLIGLNTALLADDNKDQGSLRLGKAPLAQALAAAQPGELLMVLSHHPFRGGWLADQRDADAWVRNHAHLHLSGHVREADSEQARGGCGGDFLRVSAGAAHADTPSHGYNLAAVVRGPAGALSLRLWPRRWNEKKMAFVPDQANLSEGHPFAEHPLRPLSPPRPAT